MKTSSKTIIPRSVAMRRVEIVPCSVEDGRSVFSCLCPFPHRRRLHGVERLPGLDSCGPVAATPRTTTPISERRAPIVTPIQFPTSA